MMTKYKIMDSASFQPDGVNGGMLFDCISEKAFTLNRTSTLIWQLLENGNTLEEIIQIFCDHGVPREETEKSVTSFIEELKKNHFITEV